MQPREHKCCSCPLCEENLSLSKLTDSAQFSSVAQSCPTLQPHGLQHARPPCPSPAPGVYSNSCPLSQWCHSTISSAVIPFSSRLQSFPASGSFLMSQFLTSGGQSIGVPASASVLPMNIQDWLPLGWTGWVSLLSKGLSGVFSNTTFQKHQFFKNCRYWKRVSLWVLTIQMLPVAYWGETLLWSDLECFFQHPLDSEDGWKVEWENYTK